MEKFKELQSLLAETEADATKAFEKGNKAAGTRVRKAMQQIKVLAQEVRVEILDLK